MSPYAVNYADELAYYDRMGEVYRMELEEDIARQEREKIRRLELQAQAHILRELDARVTDGGGNNWLAHWIDLTTSINQQIKA